MATLKELVNLGELVQHIPELRPKDLPERAVYFAPGFNKNDLEQLEKLPRKRGRDLTPIEQIEQILFEFVIGRRFAYGSDHRKLDPLTQHVWELKTEDVRLFGWIPLKAHFIIVRGELKDNLIPSKKYTPYIDQTIAFRNQLNLDEPKFITGTRHEQVL